jgi:hypothetical protein
MCIFVVSIFLLLGSDCNCYFCCISIVLKNAIEFISVDWVFWLPISLTHQIIKKLLYEVVLI